MAAPPRTRRWPRRLRRGVLIVGGLLVFLIGGALIALHTDWGREQVRSRVVGVLDGMFEGDVAIGRLDGSVLGDVVLHDVVIEDAEGAPAITAETVRIDFEVLPLLGHDAHLERVVIDGLRVVGRQDADGVLNLSRLMVPSEHESAWNVRLDALEIHGADVELTTPAQVVHLDDLELAGSLAIRAGGTLRAEVDVTGRWRERDAALSASGEVVTHAEDGSVEVPQAEVTLAGVAVRAHGVRVTGRAVIGVVSLDAPAAAVRALLPRSPVRADVALTAAVRPDPTPGVSAIELTGTIGEAPIAGQLAIAPQVSRLEGRLMARRLDVSALVPDAIETSLHVDLDLEADLAARRAITVVEARGGGGARLVLDATLQLGEAGALLIERSHLVAHADDLRRAGGARTPVRGAIDADLRARGRVAAGATSLAVDGRVHGRRLGFAAYDVRDLVVELDAHVDSALLPVRPVGRIEVTARDVTGDGQRIPLLSVAARARPDRTVEVTAHSRPRNGPWMIDAAATVRAGRAVTIELGEHRVRTHGVDWVGRGGTVVVDPQRVTVAGVRTTIADGALALDGTYHRAGAHAGDVDAALAIDGVDLREVDASLRLPGALRGSIDARAEVKREGGKVTAVFVGAANGLAVRDDAAPLDVVARAQAARGLAGVTATMRSAGVGEVSVVLDLDAPRRIEDPRAWQRLERHAIRDGLISIERIDLAALAALAGVEHPAGEPPIRGRVDGVVSLDRAETTGWIRARDVETPALRTPLDADLEVARAGTGVVTATLSASLRELVTVDAAATVQIPKRPFDVAGWAALDAGALRGATIRVDELRLDERQSRLLGLPEPWHARGDLRIDIAPAISGATAHLALRDVRGGPVLRPVALTLDATLDDDGLAATLAGAVEGADVLTAEARAGFSVAARSRDGWLAALRAAPLEASLSIERAPLRSLLRVIDRRDVATGTLSATITAGGTVGAPTGRAAVSIADLGAGATMLRRFDLDAGYDGAVVTADATGAQADGGRLAARLRAPLADLADARLRLEADDFDLAPLVHLAPTRLFGIGGIADLDLRVHGVAPETAKVVGDVHVRDAHVPIGGSIGTLRRARIELALHDKGRVRLAVDGRVGAGRVALEVTGVLDGVLPRTADVSLVTRDLSLIGEVQPRVAARVTGELTREGDHWRLVATARDGRVTVPERDGAKLHEPGLPHDLVIIENGKPPPSEAEPERTIRLGVRPERPLLIVELRIRPVAIVAKELRAELRGDLTLTIGADAMAIDGTISAARGTVALLGRRYRLDRALVRLDGTIDPILDIALVHEFPQLTLHVTLRGRVSAPELRLSSTPATYTEGQLLSFMLGNQPGADPGHETRDAATAVASTILSDKIGGYVDDYLPIDVDVLRYEAATASSSAAVTIGKWLTSKLFLAYRRRLEARPDQNIGEVEVEYWLGRAVLVDGTVGDRGHHGIDLLWLRRW